MTTRTVRNVQRLASQPKPLTRMELVASAQRLFDEEANTSANTPNEIRLLMLQRALVYLALSESLRA